jgi:DNA processing protein
LAEDTVSETEAWLRIAAAPGLGVARLEPLLAACGSATGIVAAAGSTAALGRAGVAASAMPGEATRRALTEPDSRLVEGALDWLAAGSGHRLLTWSDRDYPYLLREIPDPPLLLFVAGRAEAVGGLQLAVVGSRNPTPTGRENARDFARHLAGCGLTITSGLARGVDGAAHRGALEAGGDTVAVCGSGLDRTYPPAHADLAAEIMDRGALVSEFFPGTPPRRENFPRRNRLISGLSLGVLVVEAGLRSGSLITARMAGEQGREVFAIPGSIHNPLARGCHQLLRQGARLVESGADVLSELGALAAAGLAAPGPAGTAPEPPPAAPAEEPDPAYQALLEACGYEPVTAEILVQRTGLTAAEVSSMLLILELQGRLESGPGGRYTRI